MSVTSALGFSAAGTACGIKPGGVPDLAIVVADAPANAAGVFTTSSTAAPPVHVSRRHLASGSARAVVVNSGCANAGTGGPGHTAAIATAQAVAAAYGCDSSEVLVCSTGTIGPQLPVERIVQALPLELASDPQAGADAATAIMTTDSVRKEAARSTGGFTIGGMAKGAGMIRPDMATMLAVITTDAVITSPSLQRSLESAVGVSFNALNIDGCRSTNDTVLIMASGASGVEPGSGAFTGALAEVCSDLAHQIAADAEGATRVVTLRVTGAEDDDQARELGKFIADSDLVRASFYGGDPNWGRIFAALGAAPLRVDPDSISIGFDGVVVAERGSGAVFDEQALAERLAEGGFVVDVEVGPGSGRATVLTTDLTPEYVRFNGERS